MIVMTIYLIKIINIMITTNLTECLKEWKKNILNETDLGGWLGHPVPDYHDIQRVPRGRDRGHLSGHQGHYHHSFMHHLSLLWVYKTIIFFGEPIHKGGHWQSVFLLFVRLVEVLLKQTIHPAFGHLAVFKFTKSNILCKITIIGKKKTKNHHDKKIP